jgi:hypothetical protein
VSGPVAAFAGLLLLTVLLLAFVVLTGLRARRRLHLTLVGVTIVSLGLTIVAAFGVGELYDLESAGWITPVHLKLARFATASFVLPAATGVLTVRNGRVRPWHRGAAVVAVTLTVAAALTGFWMLLEADSLA